jgi:opacity protein-like surface antigen
MASPQDNGLRSAWNVDVVGSYTFLRAFALYGRVGYAQELAPRATANLLMGDVRRSRDGMNYGLGMRYDVTRALGLNLEYTRFGRFGYESFGNSTLPENDQVRWACNSGSDARK